MIRWRWCVDCDGTGQRLGSGYCTDPDCDARCQDPETCNSCDTSGVLLTGPAAAVETARTLILDLPSPFGPSSSDVRTACRAAEILVR